MPDLILDTSRDTCLIALFDEDLLLDSKAIPHENNLSASLLPEILALLDKNNFNIKNISTLFVGIGPGSYTGTRIAVSTAEALSLALSCPLYPFNSLLPFLPLGLEDGPFALCFETKHAHFLLEGSLDKGIIAQDLSGRVLPPESHEKSFIKPQKEPNLSPLVPFLLGLKKSPPAPVKIIYLHNL